MHSDFTNQHAPPERFDGLPEGAKANGVVFQHIYAEGKHHRLQNGYSYSPATLTEPIFLITDEGVSEIVPIDRCDVVTNYIAPYAPSAEVATQLMMSFNEDEEYDNEYH